MGDGQMFSCFMPTHAHTHILWKYDTFSG